MAAVAGWGHRGWWCGGCRQSLSGRRVAAASAAGTRAPKEKEKEEEKEEEEARKREEEMEKEKEKGMEKVNEKEKEKVNEKEKERTAPPLPEGNQCLGTDSWIHPGRDGSCVHEYPGTGSSLDRVPSAAPVERERERERSNIPIGICRTRHPGQSDPPCGPPQCGVCHWMYA